MKYAFKSALIFTVLLTLVGCASSNVVKVASPVMFSKPVSMDVIYVIIASSTNSLETERHELSDAVISGLNESKMFGTVTGDKVAVGSGSGIRINADIKEIKRLRELTGVGMTDAKKALVESNGDFDKALDAMRKKGLTKAEKSSEREARAGVIGSYLHDSRIGVLIEVNCETDFVARNEIFTDLVKNLAMHIAASAPEYVSEDYINKTEIDKITSEFKEKAKLENKPDDMIDKIVEGQVKKYFQEKTLLSQSYIKNPDQDVATYVKENIAKLGENIVVKRFSRMALGEVTN